MEKELSKASLFWEKVVLLRSDSNTKSTEMQRLSTSDKAKIGNAVVYIAQRVPQLSKTKLLKLLYLMEEYSVARFQTPFLGLQYEVWQAGPVAKDIFIDLSETPILLDGFVAREVMDGKTYITATRDFSDEEFSDNDMTVMDDILRIHGQKTARQLVELTHGEQGLWYATAKRNNLLQLFDEKLINNSDCPIDLGELLPECSREFYEEQMEFLKLARSYDD